jgi:hypothetical protein
MRYVRDTVHGFRERPHYEEAELDAMFEGAVTEFLRKKYDAIRFPISTDDLTLLIEQDVADLDQYADLTCFGTGVDGVTEFVPQGKPRVSISETVHRHENRLRTTLTHEYGHVRLHAYLFSLEQRRLALGSNRKPNAIYCMRDGMLPTAKRDWMEWQAGYASGAALMPKTHVIKAVAGVHSRSGVYGPVSRESIPGKTLIAAVIDAFAVSREAAAVRLKLLRFLGEAPASASLFS